MGNSDQTLGAAFDVLLETVAGRIGADPSESYTAQLLARGTAVAARKLGEEAVEAVIAACTGDREGLVGEAADVLFHLGVLLASAGVAPEAVAAELVRRRGQSGLDEKSSRPAT